MRDAARASVKKNTAEFDVRRANQGAGCHDIVNGLVGIVRNRQIGTKIIQYFHVPTHVCSLVLKAVAKCHVVHHRVSVRVLRIQCVRALPHRLGV